MPDPIKLKQLNQMQPMSGGQMVDGQKVGGKYIAYPDPSNWPFRTLFPGKTEYHFLALFQDAVKFHFATGEKPTDNFTDEQIHKETLVVPYPHQHTHTYHLRIQSTADAIIFHRTHFMACIGGGKHKKGESTLTYRFADKSVHGS